MTITTLRNQKLLSARKIARSLGEAEETIDTSILAQTSLLTAIVDGRRQSGVGIQVGHAAVEKAIAVLNAMATARSLVMECHADLADVRDTFRFRAEDVGCTVDKGANATSEQAQAA